MELTRITMTTNGGTDKEARKLCVPRSEVLRLLGTLPASIRIALHRYDTGERLAQGVANRNSHGAYYVPQAIPVGHPIGPSIEGYYAVSTFDSVDVLPNDLLIVPNDAAVVTDA